VWAWISQQGAGVAWRIDGILNGQKYLDILENVMLPTVSQLYGNNFIFLHNGGIVSVRQWFATNNIEVIPWSSNSPDLNVVENVWGLLVKKNYRRNFRPQNANELWASQISLGQEVFLLYNYTADTQILSQKPIEI
jgi:hypothetical protein